MDHSLSTIAEGIHMVDSGYMGRSEFTACYLLEHQKELAVIETNTAHAVPRILGAISELGYQTRQVKYVIVTHIHLDHAGGAGQLMAACPNASLVVHPRGERHMVKPDKLIQSVKQVYGDEEYHRLYGEITDIPQNRVMVRMDGERIELGARVLYFIDTPGHARHHFVVHDEHSGSLFSGDAFGLAYPRFIGPGGRFCFPSTSPVQFDPDAALASYHRLVELKPQRICLTHYGALTDIDSAHRQLRDWTTHSADLAGRLKEEGLPPDVLEKRLYEGISNFFSRTAPAVMGRELSREDVDYMELDLRLNAQGLAVFIARQES